MLQHRVSSRVRHNEGTSVTPSQSYHTPNVNMIRNEVISVPPSHTHNLPHINYSNNSRPSSTVPLIEDDASKWCCC